MRSHRYEIVRVDSHVHVWPRNSGVNCDPSIAAAGSTVSLAAAMRSADIAAAVLIQPFTSGLDHSYLLGALRSTHLCSVGIAQADPEEASSLETIATLVEIANVVGFRLPLARADDNWLSRHANEYWAVASASNVVVSLLATPAHLEQIASAAADHPSVPVVIDHLARFDLGGDPDASIDKLCRLASLPNVHVKASALNSLCRGAWPYRDLWPQLFAVIDSFGTRRVMWGSDYPFVLSSCSYAASALAVEQALAESYGAEMPDILGANAIRLFFRDQQVSH